MPTGSTSEPSRYTYWPSISIRRLRATRPDLVARSRLTYAHRTDLLNMALRRIINARTSGKGSPTILATRERSRDSNEEPFRECRVFDDGSPSKGSADLDSAVKLNSYTVNDGAKRSRLVEIGVSDNITDLPQKGA